jgi:predicted AlkP superfamily phosphohydrolase/phosphomutase
MANTPKKVAVIGLDCALPHLIEQHIKEGHLPTFKKLIEGGVMADNCLVPYPTVTPPNWASIATGAWPGTHCITDFHNPQLGKTPDNTSIVQAFSSERCKAEYMWDAADKAGKKCIVLNYPGSWPNHMKNGIMVGGSGLSVSEMRDGLPGMGAKSMLCADALITTGIYPGSIRGKFQPAEGWKNLPKSAGDPLAFSAQLKFKASLAKPAETIWQVLVYQSKGDGYDKTVLSPTKDFKDAFCDISVGQWSPKIVTKIKLDDGSENEVFFRCKLIQLSDDAEDFRLYLTNMGSTSGWSYPAEIAAEINSPEGIFAVGGGVLGYALEWFEMDTFVEIGGYYTQWLADAATTLLSKHEWDVFFMHAHSPDWSYHMMLTDMDPGVTKDKAKHDAAWAAHLKIYEAQDKMIAQILQVLDKDTLVILVSDHGAVADGAPFNPSAVLAAAGLCTLGKSETIMDGFTRATGFSGEINEFMGSRPDAKKSKALAQRSLYIYVNLKGRDPEGIVDPKDYETVQQQIIDAMYSYVDPKTGKRPVSLALSKRDARILGLYGDYVGDVVYAVYPWFAGQHANILPAAEWGTGSLKGLLTFTGPGIKKGFRLERNSGLIDIVPTICYLMNLPLPAQAEGAVIYQILADPDFKSKEIGKLRDGLAKMEQALQSGEKH